MKLKSVLFVSILAASLTLTSCAGSKKKTAANEPANLNEIGKVDNGENKGVNFDLNGDSDSNRAGALKTVFFGFNSSAIEGSTRDALNSNAEFLKSNGSVKVLVEGHCDERGSVQFNLALGEKRAKTVKDYLASQGVAANRVTIVSLGKEKPVSFGHDEESWSKNRRANFVITEK